MIGESHFHKIRRQQCGAFCTNTRDQDARLTMIEQRLADTFDLLVRFRSAIDYLSSTLAHFAMVIDLSISQVGEGLFAQRKQCCIDRGISRNKLFEHGANVFGSHSPFSFHHP